MTPSRYIENRSKPIATGASIFLAALGMLLASGRTFAGENETAPAPFATLQVIAEGDLLAQKSATVLPRANQTEWMRLERTFFLHFGVNTFNQVEWGTGREEPSLFNPTALDANQWLGAIQKFGGKMLVLVCKHHDGFCLWPTRYTPHSVAASPWRGGQGDLVREAADAARSRGIKLGVYLSPADLYQLRTNPKNPDGYYGNGSSNVLSVIPTEPASFKSDPSKGAAPAPGFGSYTYVVDDYNRYFLNQLYELLTQYGPIGEVWFDGANPDPSVHETYNYAAWYHLIRSLQPNAVIMGKGPDVRWVGNEGGVGRTTEWSVIPLPTPPDKFNWPDMTAGDLGSRARLKPGSYLWWYPAEVNTTILQNSQWFWAQNKQPRTVTQLVDIFYTSVGRNGNLILNLSPDKRGLVPDNQVEALERTAEIINQTFATGLAAGGKVTADSANTFNGPSLVMDGNLDTWWEAAPGKTNVTVTLTLPKVVAFDVVSLQEAVDHRGQRVESFAIETWDGTAWVAAQHIASDELTTIGHRRLIRLKSPVSTDQVRIRITGSRLEPTLAELGLFKQSVATLPPTISDRSTGAAVSLSNLAGYKMVYTLDGSEPSASSELYNGPIVLPLNRSVTVRAASVLPDGKLGISGSRIFAGLMPLGWKVVQVDSEETVGADNSAARAIDGDSSTIWHTRWNSDQKQPHSITVDMGKSHRIRGFTYLPRQDGLLNGVVEKYRFETSESGATWSTNIADSSFANIQNNPSLQEVSFAPVDARYFRFTSLSAVWGSGWTSAAEISVLPADSVSTGQPLPLKKRASKPEYNLFPPYFAWNNNFSHEPVGWHPGTEEAPQWTANFDFATNGLYGYPASIRGWHYGWNPADDILFPKKLSDTTSLPCSFSYNCGGEDLHGDFAYDLFLRHDEKKSVPQLEVMVWAGNNSTPIGRPIATNIIAADQIEFDLWAGTNSSAGYFVYSFMPHRKTAQLPTEGSLNVDMMDFLRLLQGRNYFTMDMYLDVVEAGFEIVRGKGWVTCGWFSCEAE